MSAFCDGNLSTDCKIYTPANHIDCRKTLYVKSYIAVVFIDAMTSWWLFQIICQNMCALCLDQLFYTPNKAMHV